MRVLLVAGLLALTMMAGCLGGEDDLRIAFVAKDTATAPHEDLDAFAAAIEAATGRPTTVHFFTSSTAALQAVKSGQADIASVDGAAGWLAWRELGLEAVASEVRADGRTHYVAAAWVRADSDIESFLDFAGRDSCHTGATKSAGMLMPMSYLVQHGLVNTADYADDISEVQQMARDFFGTATIGGAYEGYEGALRCLSEGVGEIAFVRDSTPSDYCADANGHPWCLSLDGYRLVQAFGPVPEHPFMVRAGDVESLADVVDALVALKDDETGRAILGATFGTAEIRPVTTASHLGEYGALMAHLPGITGYASSQ